VIFEPAVRSGRELERLALPDDPRRPVFDFVLERVFFLVAIAFPYTSMTTGTITGLRFVISMKNRRRAVRM
jgi:hypothetical protein